MRHTPGLLKGRHSRLSADLECRALVWPKAAWTVKSFEMVHLKVNTPDSLSDSFSEINKRFIEDEFLRP